MKASWPQFLPRWLCFVASWLLLSLVFASQLYWAGYVKTWTKAFWSESVFWFSWGMVVPLVFWLCRRLHRGERKLKRYVVGFLLGAFAASLLQSMLVDSIQSALAWLESWLSISKSAAPPLFAGMPMRAVRLAGVNLPVFGAVVLAWHAATYYRELRDRQLKSAELESLLHQAQLQALRSQINPHFLFNTLHSIAELVHENPKLAEQLIVRLGELLRKALAFPAHHEVALADEVDFVKGYVEIEQMRLGDRLQVQWEIGPETLQARIPGMILQPLVENALQHGIAPLDRAGKLLISARCSNGSLHLQVRDNGPGLSPDPASRRGGIGLYNIEARLQRVYGDRHRFELINDHGLVVKVQLPFSITVPTEKASP